MKNYKIYIGGKFVATKEHIEVKSPFNGAIIAKAGLASPKHLEEAVLKAIEAAAELREFDSYKRYRALHFISSRLSENKSFFADILCKESAKPIRYATGEIDRAIQTFLIAAEESKRLPREYISLDWTPAGKGKEGLVKYFPVGLVAGISPFNFPMNLAVHKIAPAIASGCPIILKPSSSTPISTLALAEIIDKTELPKGSVSILPMTRETGNNLVTDQRINMLSFTGSPEVGWKMKDQAGKKKVILELGGNAGVIVTDSADIGQAAEKCLLGGFAYSGQVCIHAQRIYVQKTIFKKFADMFIQLVQGLRSGDPSDPETDISSMIDEKNAIRVEAWVNEAVDNGAKILAGGDRKGGYYPPTVLSETHKDMKVCALEVFGPVVTLEPYDSFNDAVSFINDSKYGLQAGVFTNEYDKINIAFNHLHVGGVTINDVPTFRVDHMPYGGIKDSGLGREGVKYAIHDMMESKILVIPVS